MRALIGLGLLIATPAIANAGPDARRVSPASLEEMSEQVHALFRSATISFVVALDRHPVYAAPDSAGVTLLLGGEEPGRFLRLDSTGEVQWHHDVARRFSGGWPPDFTPSASGTVMSTYVVIDEEGPTRYLILQRDGRAALDDTLEAWLGLSPDGQYYFDVGQHGNEVVLNRVSGGKWRIRIPSADDSDTKPRDSTVGFVGVDRIMITQVSGSNHRSGLIDLRSWSALWTELEFPALARPACFDRLQAGIAHLGELIYVDYPDSTLEQGKVYGFDPDGRLLWAEKMKGEWIWGWPKWVVCSADQDVAAVIAGYGLGIIDTRTGRLLDVHDLDADLVWMFEGSFERGRLNLIGQGGVGNRPCLIQAAVDADGKITSLKEHEVFVRGLASGAMSCMVARGDSAQPWIVTGFRK